MKRFELSLAVEERWEICLGSGTSQGLHAYRQCWQTAFVSMGDVKGRRIK